MLSLPECITWMTVGLAEFVAIVTLNLCTIIVFIKNRNLRKRNTYLLINLAVIDMLGGGSLMYHQFYTIGTNCHVWKPHSVEYWAFNILLIFSDFFQLGSLTNITIIALERMHATFRPFVHRVLKKSVYGIIIAIAWVTASLVVIAYLLLVHFGELFQVYFYIRSSFIAMCLLIISVSYVSIVIKVRCGAQPQHHGAASRERKLTMTLLIVTVVSLLMYLPFVMLGFILFTTEIILKSLSSSEVFHLLNAIYTLYFANHFVNPILYAIRMPEYRSAVVTLFRKRPQQQRQVADLPLRDM